MKIAHFIGASKPWHVQLDPAGQPLTGSGAEHANRHLKYWLEIFHSDVSNKCRERVVGDNGDEDDANELRDFLQSCCDNNN